MECDIGKWIASKHGETWEMIDMFILLIELVISQMYIVYIHISNCTKLYVLNSTVCQLYIKAMRQKNVFYKRNIG